MHLIAAQGFKLFEMGVKTFLVLGGWRRNQNKQPNEEALSIRRKLVRYGVDKSDIIIDAESRNTTENAIAARHLLYLKGMWDIGDKNDRYPSTFEDILQDTKNVVVVAASFHSRRSIMTDVRWIACEGYGSGHIEERSDIVFTPFPYELPSMVRRNNDKSFLTKLGTSTVNNEIRSIKDYFDRGHLVDIEWDKERNGFRYKSGNLIDIEWDNETNRYRYIK